MSAGFFDVFRVLPAAGRFFTAEETAMPWSLHPEVAVISHRFWQRRDAARPDIVAHRIEVAGDRWLEVVGVAGPEMESAGEFFGRPLGAGSAGRDASARRDHAQQLEGLRPVCRWPTRGRSSPSFLRNSQPRTLTYRGRTTSAESLHDAVTGDVRAELGFLMGAVLIIALLMCANVVNLFRACLGPPPRADDARRSVPRRAGTLSVRS